MNLSTVKSPGVYINEINAFGNTVVPVATAIPAFIGYRPQAIYEGKSYTNVPAKITSFAEFLTVFCYPNPAAPAAPVKQYSPEYYLVKEKSKPAKGDHILIGDTYYTVVPDPYTVYYLYNSIRLFYENGGGDAYIVSVGTYGPASDAGMATGAQIINPNVVLNDLLSGLALLKTEQEPTFYICPEATLLSVIENGTLMQEMLLQCSAMQTAVCIFDIIGGRNPKQATFMNSINVFRDNTGNQGLSYGAAYYPFVGTTIMQTSDIDYTNLFGGDVKQLKPLLSPASAPNTTVDTILSDIETPPSAPLKVSQYNNALLAASTTYTTIIKHVLNDANMLPPSGGMAGVITTVDNNVGVWKAPANISITGVTTLPIELTNEQQAYFNIDAVSGKSINAIRTFNGRGTLIWGARTLDGNSLDWKYLPVRRTMTFLEQSCKQAVNAYVFEPNDKNTWTGVVAMISSFLSGIWKEGGLQGATAAAAFNVECSLGSTMTSDDILNGFMNVSVKVAIVRPAEFIVFTFQQEMTKS